MKKALIFTSLGILLFGGVFLTYAKDNSTSGVYPSKTCDINGDRKIDKADLDELTNLILNGSNVINKNYDFNGDGDVTISDVMYCSAKITEDTTENECQGMDKANITHSIDGDTIIFNWDVIEGENVEISILDPEDETYKIIGNVRIRNKIFVYKIKWQGEQNFKFSNGCNDYYYKVNVNSKQENICDQNNDGEISVSDISLFTKICSPTNGIYTGDIKKCDINNDGEISVTDLNLFSEKCLNEIMETNNEDSNATDCNDDEVKSACSSLDNIDKCPDMCKPDGILTNNHTKTVEFNSDEVSRKVVFDGTYHAIKDSNIIGFYIEHDNIDNENCKKNISYNNIEFKLYINGELVASHLNNSGNGITLNSCQYYGSLNFKKTINVKNGDSIKVKIEGRLDNDKNNNYKESLYSYKLGFLGNNKQGTYKIANEDLAPIRIVNNNDRFTIEKLSNKKTVYLKGMNNPLAEFIIRPASGKNAYLNELELEIDDPFIEDNNIKLVIDGEEYDFTTFEDGYVKNIICQPDLKISSKGIPVKLILKKELNYDDYKITTTVKTINEKPVNDTFSKRFVSVLVYIAKQENMGNHTKYTLGVEKYNDNYYVNLVCMLTPTDRSNCFPGRFNGSGSYEKGYTFEIVNSKTSQPINYIDYLMENSEQPGWADSITIEKEDYPDYFKVNGDDRRIYGYKINSYSGEYGVFSGPTNNKENSYPSEMIDAYNFAYENGITTVPLENAKLYSTLTRIQMAKMLSNYATNVLGMEPDTAKGIIKFNDVTDKMNKNHDYAVNTSYGLGIMGINMKNNNFRPNDEVTKAEFATALSRLLYGTQDGKPYYATHLEKLKNEGIISDIDNPKAKQLRGYAMIMLMRAANQ